MMKSFLMFAGMVLFSIQIINGQSFAVNSFSPPAQSMNFLPSLEIVINFNTSIDITSFDDTTFQVFGRWSGIHRGNISVFNDTSSILFTPDKNFFYGEWVTVSLSKGIRNANGDSLSKGFAWNFWTKSLSGTMDLFRSTTISTREPGEGWIQTYGTYAGDFNGDGWSDFVVPNERPADVRVFLNDQAGGYHNFTEFPVPNGLTTSTNEGFDYNNDGLLDFTVGSGESDIVTVFQGDGMGGFPSSQNYITGNGVRGLVVLDANGDGFYDIVTASRYASFVSVLINNGDGTFAQAVNFDAGIDGETALATADVNADGIMDFFVGGINSDQVALFLGDGDGGFVSSDVVVTGNGPWMVATGDVNGDGVPDVVCANSSEGTVAVVLCDSTGNLGSPVTYPVGAFPLSVDLGDIDGDNDLDLVSANFSGDNFTIYENDGSGNFINRNDLPSNSAGSCVVLHDRDNDGDMDMTGIDELEDLLILFTNDGPVNAETNKSTPDDFKLFQNYPNPFNPTTKIKYQIPGDISIAGRNHFVSIIIYDIIGNKVATLVNEEKPAGNYEVNFDASGLASGMYFYSLKVGKFSETKKMILMK
jgi:FG-GAP-like repeat/Secretion system C-terminal sorting domain/Bacterial Ig-like domain